MELVSVVVFVAGEEPVAVHKDGVWPTKRADLFVGAGLSRNPERLDDGAGSRHASLDVGAFDVGQGPHVRHRRVVTTRDEEN